MVLQFAPNRNAIVKQVNENVGFGVFSTSEIQEGDIVYTDRPLVSIQHTANRRFVQSCQNCHKMLGSLQDKFRQIFNEDRFAHVDLSCLPSAASQVVNCVCGEMYCSLACGQEAHSRHHYCLCVANGEFGQLISDFKFYCLSVEGCGDNLLLLAQTLAVLNSMAKSYDEFCSLIKDILSYTNGPFETVARPSVGSERDEEWLRWLKETITEAFELLSLAFQVQSENFRFFFSNKPEAFSICSRILSVFELNNIDICIPSTMGSEVRKIFPSIHQPRMEMVLREKEVVMRALWNDEAMGIYEDEEEEDESCGSNEMSEESSECMSHCHEGEHIDEMLCQIREEVGQIPLDQLVNGDDPAVSSYPSFHGTGFYLSVARTNHSCAPNVSMDFDAGTSLVACKALRKINSGEELRMSYISRCDEKSVKQRKAQLGDYLFDCACDKCEIEQLQAARPFAVM